MIIIIIIIIINILLNITYAGCTTILKKNENSSLLSNAC
jgi:hypothetical protein